MNIKPLHARTALVGALVGASLLLSACGDDTVGADSPDTVESTTPPADDVPAVEVRAADFGFGGLPRQVAPGTAFRLVNDSTVELHELVAIRLADDDERPIEEIVHHDVEALLASGPPAMVLLAAPGGGEQIVAVGDGTLTEPGRYALLCMIPTGVDPAEYLAAAAESQGGPPDVAGGAPHIAHGMFAEIVVG